MRFSILALTFTGLLAGCVSTTPHSSAITSFYDYQLHTPSGDAIAVANLTNELQHADVILVGEWHTHAGIHRFQTDLLQQLSAQPRPLALSMEQIARDKQTVVDAYLKGKIGEQFFMQQSDAWPNYASDYRPLIEFAKQAQIPVIAANAPKNIVRCIGRQGVSYLDKLTEQERHSVASSIDTSASPYKKKFMASLHHGTPEQTEKQFAAQVTWDETMADSIVEYLDRHPGTQVMHIAGKFHTEEGLGTAQSILNRNPALKIAIITPTTNVTSDSHDYQLQVLEPPQRYVQQSNRLKAYQHLAKRNDELTCR
ncbi:ChaN family lipoprotein [Vibrio sp. CAU 1672]|uniref:ChaN family lipoprotein n=1 Tax=Vibrio sp. CAU 1672 TaxID=3032594 RepID=UPI0023DB0D0D|nr:ChaN family lipoprotein [Vibrio sp. CAU 1672]MDF2153812.1 ChaN family lipoprotein [Vibrio sp. CAU 1672]